MSQEEKGGGEGEEKREREPRECMAEMAGFYGNEKLGEETTLGLEVFKVWDRVRVAGRSHRFQVSLVWVCWGSDSHYILCNICMVV